MAQTIKFDGKHYGHQQFWSLFRELMERGFFVKIVGNKRDDGQLAYGCKLTNWKLELEPIQTVPCTTPWVALVAAITLLELQMGFGTCTDNTQISGGTPSAEADCCATKGDEK